MELTGPPGSGVSTGVRDGVAVVEIDRPPHNYFDVELLVRLADDCEELQARDDVRAVVVCSRGRHFCAGADFTAPDMVADRAGTAARVYAQALRLVELQVPVVAAVQGGAIGGGLGLACVADLRVGSTRSWFHANFARLGIHHGFALSATLPHVVGAQAARRALLAADKIDGATAHRIGLVDELTEPGQERAGALRLAAEVAASARDATRAIKLTMTREVRTAVRAAVEHELEEQRRLWTALKERNEL